MLNFLSYYDTKIQKKKNLLYIYRFIICLQDKYYVHSNRESGLGRYDIVLEPKDIKRRTAYIMEFKVAKVIEELESKAKEAIKQIEEKKYDTELKSRGIENIIKLGIAFCGKKIKIISK